jgi:ElaB/YqjD/DUF883 family membrane-anchored ribosome-binding protein
MPNAASASPSYVKYAIADQHNLILLFGAAVFSLAYASPLPVLAAGVAELLWLVVGPRSKAFRALVDNRIDAQQKAYLEAEMDSALGKLPEAYSARFQALKRNAEEVLARVRERADVPPQQLRSTAYGLLTMRRIFLDFQALARRVLTLVEATPTANLEEEMLRLQQAFAADRDLSARMTIRKALTQTQRQLQQQQQLLSLGRTVELRLDTIEKGLGYLKDQVIESGTERLPHEFARVLGEVGLAQELEPLVDDILNAPMPAWAPLR